MKLIHYKYLSIALLLLTLGSCKKFLEEKPTNFLSPGFTITSTKEAQALVNGCYTNLTGLAIGQPSSYGGNTWVLMEFMTGKSNSDLGQTGFVNFQTLTYNNTSFYVDTWWVEDGSFIRGQNMTLGYTIPEGVVRKMKLSRIRIAASVQNFFLHTKYTGYDPEVDTFNTTYGNTTGFSQNLDFFSYPRPRVYNLALTVGF